MATLLSVLRGINVSGKNKIKMVDLRDLYGALGLKNAQTYVQSGNVVFHSDKSPPDVADKIRDGIRAEFGYEVAVQVYTLDQWRALVAGNPFAGGNANDPAHLHVTLLAENPDAEAVQAIADFDAGGDRFYIDGATVYLHCPNGYGRSKLTNSFWEKKLNVSATTRNWKTMNNVLGIAKELEATQA